MLIDNITEVDSREIGNMVAEVMEKHRKPVEVLVAGNGFDLHHYLPTRYNDFIDVVKRLLELKDEENLDKCKYLNYMFGGNSPVYKQSAYIKKCYNIHNDTIQKTELDINKLKKLVNIATDNMWIKYFLSNDIESLGWIDFEKEIAKVIYVVTKYLNAMHGENSFALLEGVNIASKVFTMEEYYLFTSFPQLFITSDFQREIKLRKEFIVFRKNVAIKIDEKKIINYMVKDLDNLIQALNIYLEEFVQKITTNKKSENSLFEKIDYVINFNYTDTFARLYSKKVPIAYIHGSSNTGNMVLGINDDENDNLDSLDLRFVKFKKYYQRTIKNTDYKFKDILKNDKKYILHFVGHSLDITDRDILKNLIDNEIVVNCKIYYYDDNALHQIVSNVISLFGKEKFDNLIANKIEFLKLESFKKENEMGKD